MINITIDNNQYIKLLKDLFKVTHKIKVTLIAHDPYVTEDFIEFLEKHNIGKKILNTWPGTTGGGFRPVYTLECNASVKQYFLRLENFFNVDIKKNICIPLDIGFSDLSFYDGQHELILFTITHENEVIVNKTKYAWFDKYNIV